MVKVGSCKYTILVDTRSFICLATVLAKLCSYSNAMWYLYVVMVDIIYAKQKPLGCKNVQGQSEATLQTGSRGQLQEVTLSKYF